jgi:hypothetical protein
MTMHIIVIALFVILVVVLLGLGRDLHKQHKEN